MAEVNSVLNWAFLSECLIPGDVAEMMVEGEYGVAAYKTARDTATFTNKRIIVRDAQGLTGKKVETYSLPYSSINMWSSENAGRLLDMTTELELYTRVGLIKIKLGRGCDIRKLDQLIARYVL